MDVANMDLKEQILLNIKKGNQGIIPVKGISMEPTLREGNVLVVYAQKDYSVGDIVVYSYREEGYLVHRIIEINKGAVMCKGDNSKRIEVIMKRQIIGKVVRYISGGKINET